MSLGFASIGSLVLWALSGGAAATAIRLLAPRERSRRNRRDLAALGWHPARVLGVTAALTAAAVVAVGVLTPRIGSPGNADPLAGLHWALLVAVMVPVAMPRAVASVVLAGNRRQLDGAVLLWLRRIRLFVASGRPINAAVLDAAERVTDPAFAPAAGAINAAVIGGRDPLAAVARQLHDSPTAALLATVDAAERSGAAASQLLDRVLDRVVRAIDDRRREAIDRLGRTIGAAASGLAVLASAVVMITIVMTLPST